MSKLLRAPHPVVIEFFGVPRRRAGRAALTVAGTSVAEALVAVEQACPSLRGIVQTDGRLHEHYLLSLNGVDFVTDLDLPLKPGDRLLLLSADAGG